MITPCHPVCIRFNHYLSSGLSSFVQLSYTWLHASQKAMLQFKENGAVCTEWIAIWGIFGNWVLYYSYVMNYDGFNRPTFEIVRVWKNPWKCMIQPNISMTIISYTLLNDDVPAIMKTSILCRLCLSTSQRRIENYIADFLMMELRRMYLWYISLL